MAINELNTRSTIDKLWTEFWTGGITNPLTVIEQITYLFFCRMLDEEESKRERIAKRTGKTLKALFFGKDQQNLRWKNLKQEGGEPLLALVRDKVFPFLRSLNSLHVQNTDSNNKIGLGTLMKDAQLLIVKPALLSSAIKTIDSMDMKNTDTKGDLYEHLLSKLSTAGINGQFRTPRHILETMVQLIEPKPTDVICDPACGTAGFLVKVMEYLREQYTSPELVYENERGQKVYAGDKLMPYMEHINNNMFYGFDFDLTMLRLSAMNMMLHGVEGQCIYYQDTLSESFKQNYPQEANSYFDIILANPPFKGNFDPDDLAQELTRKVKSTKTELLFLVRMLDMLKLGGRCAVIVPDGVLFGSSKAHIALRTLLLEENQLDAVISLPSGVFKPYAGVSTAILLFTKGGTSENIFFYDVQADGLSLDDKRSEIKDNDLPELIETYKTRDANKLTDREAKAFYIPFTEIKANNYDLSLSRYKVHPYIPEIYDDPRVILERMTGLEKEIMQDMDELKGLL